MLLLKPFLSCFILSYLSIKENFIINLPLLQNKTIKALYTFLGPGVFTLSITLNKLTVNVMTHNTSTINKNDDNAFVFDKLIQLSGRQHQYQLIQEFYSLYKPIHRHSWY